MVDDEALEARKLRVTKALHIVLKEPEGYSTTYSATDSRSNNNADWDRQSPAKPLLDETIARKYNEISYETKIKALKAAEENEQEAWEYCQTMRADLKAIGIVDSIELSSSSINPHFFHRLFCLKIEWEFWREYVDVERMI